MDRRIFLHTVSLAATGSLLLPSCFSKAVVSKEFYISPALSREMYAKALSIAKSKIRGGVNDPVFKKPFVDAAFSSNIFYWDTCFIAAYAKYHTNELPIHNALDNFYSLMDTDGFICREYTKEGQPMWPKEHPVSVNPPLLAFAELELYSQTKDVERLKKVYPMLKKHFEYWTLTWRMEDKLLFNDALGSGMDNIERYPRGWTDDHQGIPMRNLHPELFSYEGLNPKWNKQGRMVDVSAQYALFAKNIAEIAVFTGKEADIAEYENLYMETKNAINQYCWNEEDGFYYDLCYGKQFQKKHIGMFWVMLAGVLPEEKAERFIAHLTDPKQFWRKIPVATTSADEPEFSPAGDYWRGAVWSPTNYMILIGLLKYGPPDLAEKLARQYYWSVAEVYKKTKTFWENYAPDFIDKGNVARPDFCGWTGIAPIAVYKEFIEQHP